MLKFSQENMKYDCLVNIQGLKPASSANDLSVGRDKKLICFHNYLCQLRCKYWTNVVLKIPVWLTWYWPLEPTNRVTDHPKDQSIILLHLCDQHMKLSARNFVTAISSSHIWGTYSAISRYSYIWGTYALELLYMRFIIRRYLEIFSRRPAGHT